MSVLYLVIPIALLMSAGAVATFLWAVRRGQFDDLSTPGMRMLHDNEVLEPKPGAPAKSDAGGENAAAAKDMDKAEN